MKVFNLKNTLLIAALVASEGAVSGLGEREWPEAKEAIAPSPQAKARARDASETPGMPKRRDPTECRAPS